MTAYAHRHPRPNELPLMSRPAPAARMPILGGFMLASTVVLTVLKGPGSQMVLGLSMALMALIGVGRLFRTGVSRTATEVVCRFVPRYE